MKPQTPLGELERTDRGFEFIRFIDRYGASCILQQSSIAEYEPPGSSAVWLGLSPNHRMHIDLKQARALVSVLEQWTISGSFVPDKGPEPERGMLEPGAAA